MRTLVFLLVLANLLFLAYTEGYFGRPDNPDAQRVEQQVTPERVQVVSRSEAPAEKPAARPEAVLEKRPGEAPANGQAMAGEAATEVAPPVCLAWAGLAATDADRLAALLAEKFDDFRQSRRQVASEGATWWVFVPPLANKAEAEKKATELKRLGVEDYFVIQEAGPNRFGISLGVFSSENGARDRLAELRGKGVRTAKMGPRPGKDVQHAIEASGPASRQAALLAAVAGVLPATHSQACK